MKKIVLLGHGVGVKFVIDSIKNNFGDEYVVSGIVTHPYKDHLSDLEMLSKREGLYGKYAYNVFNIKKDYDIPLFEAENVNDLESVEWIKEINPSFIISIGCRNIIKKDFLESFRDRVLNIHTTPLPKYKGGASDSWMILNGLSGTEQFGCVHYIDTGIDTGNIIAKSYYTIPLKAYPIDVYKSRMDIFEDLVRKLFAVLASEDKKGEVQDVSDSSYFPRLNTSIDGKIDFKGFSGEEIVRFTYAFGYPFEGAWCYFEGVKVNILEVEFKNEIKFHSYLNGIVFGKNDKNEYKIAINEGYLLVKKIEVEGKETSQNKVFKLGRRVS